MKPVRGETENYVADLDMLSGHDFLAVNYAHDKSSKVVFAFGIEPGHLGSLPADQCTAVVLAGVGKSFDYFFRNVGIEFAGRQIIHEEQGCCALHGNVIHAMVDEIPANGVVDSHVERNFQLGADSVNAGDENGV